MNTEVFQTGVFEEQANEEMEDENKENVNEEIELPIVQKLKNEEDISDSLKSLDGLFLKLI